MGHALWRIFDSAIPITMLLIYLGAPLVALWGCIRWYKAKSPGNIVAGLSYTGFWLATASGLLAIWSLIHGMKTGGAAYYAPSFPLILRGGFLVSAIAAALALGGIWRRNPLRWHAAICSFAMLFYWSAAIFE